MQPGGEPGCLVCGRQAGAVDREGGGGRQPPVADGGGAGAGWHLTNCIGNAKFENLDTECIQGEEYRFLRIT